jgi:diaminohydroxyphosphoribosylaminopyrimidine deaminase/5-amino-6-(5-phosphoribosylamino)uracil reductase
VGQAREAARGGTAYLNLESGDCHGDRAAVDALVAAGVARVVVGLRHPLPHLRGTAISALRAQGVAVAVLGEAPLAPGAAPEAADEALDACLAANDALLHRAVLRRPLGLLKYAMTLDGKIATHTGHSAWVSSAQSRQEVFRMRARSDAVIVGGCTGVLVCGGGQGLAVGGWVAGCKGARSWGAGTMAFGEAANGTQLAPARSSWPPPPLP